MSWSGPLLAPLLALLAPGCRGEPETLADCTGLRDTSARENCRLAMVSPVAGDPKALEAALAQIPEPQSRDLLLYRLVQPDPGRLSHLCREIQDRDLARRCQNIQGRPHLSTQPPK